MSIFGDPEPTSTSRTVSGPGGGLYEVFDDQEYEWLLATLDGYLKLQYTEPSDLQDIDEVVGLELSRFRFNRWLTRGLDYANEEIPDRIKLSAEIRQLSTAITAKKNSLKLSASTRKSEGAESFAEWLDDMRRKARVFAHENRITLAQQAISDFYELQGMITTFRASDQEERMKKGITTEAQILDWVLTTAAPRIAEIDRKFRQEGEMPQRDWKGL